MKKTLEIINDLEAEGIIEKYSIGGAMALLFYTEPALTFDIDIFVFLPGSKNHKRLIDLGPLYRALNSKGYRSEKEHILIEGIPVQFIPAYNALVEEAIREASTKKYEGVKVRVATLEYLVAIMLDTNRPKDRERIRKIQEEARIDKRTLAKILNRYSLLEEWKKYFEKP